MAMYRVVFPIVSLAAALSPVAFADAAVRAGDARPMGQTPEWLHGTSFGSFALLFATGLLLAALLLTLSGRVGWRLGAVAFVGGCALLGGDAMLDGAMTAILVSP